MKEKQNENRLSLITKETTTKTVQCTTTLR